MMRGFSVQQSQLIAEEAKQNLVSCDQASASAPPNPARKKRTLSVNTDPNAEVITLSPKTLLATNRFACEVCGKGFKREQNLQLHRRGHNLPWKLKQKVGDEEAKKKKKVYVCPEPSCPHHEPCRALGDLTGIKKHFFRKHGEKKWSCERCSKKYAVFSDWKAHTKVCGTKEYRCDCGTVFTRRDSFITHRAFCDILTEETERTRRAYPHAMDQNQFILPQPTPALKTSVNSSIYSSRSVNYFSHDNSSVLPSQVSPHLSATELLQKAAEMGAIMSKDSENNGLFCSQEMVMGSFCDSCSELGGFFEKEIEELMAPKRESDGKTIDFLGLVDPSYKDFLIDMAGKDTCRASSSSEQHRRI